jgi:hypothetical protein
MTDTSKIKRGLNTDYNSAEYHGLSGTYSSSQLKTLLKDPELFHKEYILKTEAKKSIPAFDIGTFYHTAVLEPELLDEECAVFTGIRRGAKWEDFKKENDGKAIITLTEKKQADTLIKATFASEIAMDYIAKGTPEISAFVDLTVSGGVIFSKSIIDGEVYYMDRKDGWVASGMKDLPKGSILTVKVRADIFGDEKFILDLKSTTGNPKDAHAIKAKISSYGYDLSTSLYLDIFTMASGRLYDTFIWTFASKDMGTCKNWIASRNNVLVGRAKWMKAVVELVKWIDKDWVFSETIEELEPNFFEKEWLNVKEEDEL